MNQNDKKFADILQPKRAPSRAGLTAPKSERVEIKKGGGGSVGGSLKIFALTMLALGGSISIFYGLKIWELHNRAKQVTMNVGEKIREGASALNNFAPSEAKDAFASVANDLAGIKQSADALKLSNLLGLAQNFFPNLGKIPEALGDLINFSSHALSLSEELDSLQKNAFAMAFRGEGAALIKTLRALREELTSIAGVGAKLESHAKTFGIPTPTDYLALTVKLYRAQSFLDGLLGYLGAPGAKHIALLFQNPSEIRPSGGFIGSYAAIDAQDGSITGLDVRDIYDPDGQLADKVLPPRPLQAITGRWGARDANWFFDFPTSAAKVLSFLNNSKIYSERGVKFDSAVALNVNILEDILKVVGPIEVADYKTTINADNVLATVQREVEAGEDKKSGQPKRILKVLTPLLLERLSQLAPSQKQILAGLLRDRVAHKDIMIYFNDRALEAYAQNEGLGGEVYGVNSESADDYLAFVYANIAGGKSDAFINEKINLKSSIDVRGKIWNELTVARAHTGAGREEAWYRAPNRGFFQILTPARSRLTGLKGHDAKIPDPPITRPNYLRDPDVDAIESTLLWLAELRAQSFSQFGKTTFAGYLKTLAGETKTIAAEYVSDPALLLSDGENYRFVFDRQSGANVSLNYSVEAPPGFIWKESQSTVYEFSTENPETRIILDLTMKKI